ncbi:hypothetical protein ABZO31_00235 [Streptomyces sp. HUAS MG47]|uniref:hypothetical protein n=1 Tax=Streptomyces solicamelliae TaxID=3231716 RepID=UPI0038783D43
MHTTTALDAIRDSGQLYASSGCLVAALYCASLVPVPVGLRPHNLGAYLLETKPYTRTLVITVTPVPASGIDYLRLGRFHLNAYLQHRSFLTETEDAQLRERAQRQIRATAPLLDTLLASATGHRTAPEPFLDQLAATIPRMPFLGYLYLPDNSGDPAEAGAPPTAHPSRQPAPTPPPDLQRSAGTSPDGPPVMLDLPDHLFALSHRPGRDLIRFV